MENDRIREKAVRQLEDIFKRIAGIETQIPKRPRQYVSLEDVGYCECPTGYNGDMSCAMASDMACFRIMLSGKYPGLAGLLDGWAPRMARFNGKLVRMMDDDADGRPIGPWKFKKALEFASRIQDAAKTAMGINKTGPDSTLDSFIGTCRVWAARIIYMNTWAYYLENMADIGQVVSGMQAGAFAGLDRDKKKCILAICRVRRKLTELAIEIPVDTKDYKYVMDKLDLFNRMCHIIMKMEG